jgi:hypothetical protein
VAGRVAEKVRPAVGAGRPVAVMRGDRYAVKLFPCGSMEADLPERTERWAPATRTRLSQRPAVR